ncbi:MAG: hypothetical protein JSV42_04265 [Chloroflexota bacterium]|nr:MAG: hypothetical protein JSV42_04265 [Chloroflexota bacterium]
MVLATLSLREDYWETFDLLEEDIEFIYNYLLELETPLTPNELVEALVEERIGKEIQEFEKQRTSAGDIYFPKESFREKQKLIFPALGWRKGEVVGSRPGVNPDITEFTVISVKFENGEQREFASEVSSHVLNDPPIVSQDDVLLNPDFVIENYGNQLIERLEIGLNANEDFVRIAGRWFPRALLVDVNQGHLNLAEAVLDMAGGGPLPTNALLEQVELPSTENSKLVEFSLDLGLEEDARFDEVGPAGEVLWFLRRLEPQEVLETPKYLRYHEIEHDRSLLNEEMLALERELDDEHSPIAIEQPRSNDVVVSLNFPHWRVGSLPLSSRIEHLFPTAYEAPRIRFILEDRKSGESFPGWVVREKKYVFGLHEWYESQGLMPGSLVRVQRGKDPGKVIVSADSRRSSREWIRTVLVGTDGGTVFAMLKQVVSAAFDERMAIAIPDVNALDTVWKRMQKERPPFERVVVDIVRELSKLNPQGHVHASELYAAVNVVRRSPPAPILALLASRPWFVHVGDLHFRFDDSEHA